MKRAISLVLAFAMLIGVVPQLAFASEVNATVNQEETVRAEQTAQTEPLETNPVQTEAMLALEMAEPTENTTGDAAGQISGETVEESETDSQIALLASDTVITTDEEFRAIASNSSGSYTLGANLSLSAETVKAMQNCYFTGNLDGDGHTISFSIDETVNNACGLFNGLNGIVQNVTLQATINLSGCTVNEVGLLASNFGQEAYIYNCNVKGSITVSDPSADSYPIIGGIIGNGNGLVEKCKVEVSISLTTGGSGEIGGIVGALYSGQIIDSHYHGTISLEQTGNNANYYSVTGLANGGTATDCTVGGTISANTTNASGRVVGAWNASNSFNNAAITLTTETGSIYCVGASGGTDTNNSGKITLTTTGDATSYAYGLELLTSGINSGEVTAEAQMGSITASGLSQCIESTNEASISANNTNGDAFAGGASIAGKKNINRGTIQANATNGVAMAKGVNGNGSAEECFNYGAVSVTANQGEARAYGIDGCSYSENIGNVTANSLGETSSNSSAAGAGGYCVINQGSIRCEASKAEGVAFAYGIQGTGSTYSRNYGTVQAVAGNSHATARGVEGSYCENYGEVTANSSGPGDEDRGSATAYGTSEKGSNSYNTAMITAVSKYSAARAYGAGESSSVSDGTAYANSEYYEQVTEDEKTVYKMGYVYAGSSLNATANLAGTAVTSSSGEDSKYIYFFMPTNSCETHSPDAAPCLTVEAIDCGCYYTAGEAASSEQKDYTSQIPDPGEGDDDDDDEEKVTADIKEYLDNSTIEINSSGSAYAYYISEPSKTYHYMIDDKVGFATSNDKGVIRVPLGTFSEPGTQTLQVTFTKLDGKQLDTEPKFTAKVKVTSLEFSQTWQASLDTSVSAKLDLGISGKLGPLELKATFGQAEAGLTGGTTLNISREYTENSETLEISSDKKATAGVTLTSGITGKAITPKFSLEASAGAKSAVSGTYGIKFENYSANNSAQQLAIATYLLGEALLLNPSNVMFKSLYDRLATPAYINSGGAVIEGSSVEINSTTGAALGALRANEEKVFSILDSGVEFATSFSEKRTTAGETEKATSWSSRANLAVFSGTVPKLQAQGAFLSLDFLGTDIEIAAKNGPGEKTVESTSLSASRTEPIFVVLGGHTVADYNQYIFKNETLSGLVSNVSGFDSYVNGNRELVTAEDVIGMGEYLSVSETPIAYNRQTKDSALYSIPFGIGGSAIIGADLGVTLSYLEDTSHTNATGYAIDNEVLLTGESVDLSEEIDKEKFKLEDIFTKAIPSLVNAAADFFKKVTGNIKDGVKNTWAWVGEKADSAADWLVSITYAPRENDGAWGESSTVSVTNTQSSVVALAHELIGESSTASQFTEAATIGRPVAVGVADASTDELITDLSEEPLTLTIRYAAEDLQAAGIPSASAAVQKGGIAMYRYSDEGDYFEYVGGTADLTAMTVTATIVKTGQYILAVDTCAPRLTKLDISDFRRTPTITATIDDFAGLDESGFRFEMDDVLKVDGSSISDHYDSSTGTFTYTVAEGEALSEGKHTMKFTLSDAAGNKETYEYEFTVDLTAPVISEATVTGITNKGSVVEIRAHVSDENLTAVYAVFSKQLSDGTWSEEVKTEMGEMGDGIWGLDYEGDGSTIQVHIVAEDIAENTAASETYAVTSETYKTPNEAVAEMTWGVNLSDLYMADVARPEGSTTGYIEYEPAAELGIGLWFWNYDYHWLTYHGAQRGTFTVSADFPTFESASPWTGDLLKIGIMTESTDQTISITLRDSKIVKSNGDVIPLSSMDKTYTGKTDTGPDINGWCQYTVYCPAEAPEESAELNGATFYTTVTIEDASLNLTSKADYYFQYQRYPIAQEELTDLFVGAGANVIRLPVTWTPFVNDTTFEIDQDWLEAVKSEVDYILSTGAYCILNMHNDYLQRSFVGTNQNGAWTNLHWERDWMEAQYADYVDARFAAVWKQIAEYFKDYPEQLIFETCNEPTMEWYSGVNYDVWINEQANRVNEMNNLFVETVRNTGGDNTTRILCLAVAEYNQYQRLSQLEMPEGDDYLMVQLHSYSAMENDPNAGSNVSNYDYKAATDTLFASVAAFKEQHPNVPVIIGEVGITHRESDAVQAPKVAYFFEKAKENGVPCLWWEDYFVVDSNTHYWIYDKSQQEWGRPEILKAIQGSTGSGTLTYSVKCDPADNGSISAKPVSGLAQGDTVTITVTPHAGYALDTLTVGGTNVTSQVTDNKYTFTMPASNVTVTASFKLVHAHKYTEKNKEPNCTDNGYTTYTCSCGDSYTDNEVEAVGHTWDEGKVTKEPTEETEGEKTYTCTVCKETKVETIPVLDHVHKHTEKVTAPSCTEKGYTTYTCVCGDSYTGNEVDPLGHSWDTGVVTKAPTEETEGEKTYTCTVCKETRTETVPTLDHVHTYTEEVTAPTCTEKGYTTYTCTCGESYTDNEVAALGHNWDAGTVTKQPTTESEGIMTYTCKNCPETKTEPIDKLVDPDRVSGIARIAGSGRYVTATMTATELKAVLGVEKFQTVVVASGENFPDALAGSYLAAVTKAPILLTTKAGSNWTKNYIAENLAPGGTIYLLGSVDAISQSYEDTLNKIGTVKRLKGDNRWETCVAILTEAGGNANEVLVCSGNNENFADALSASAVGKPILLINGQGTQLQPYQKAYLAGKHIIVIGDNKAVSDKQYANLAAAGASIERVQGGNRVLTSVAVANRFFPQTDFAVLAYGGDYPDALCGGPLAYLKGGPVLLAMPYTSQMKAAADYITTAGITKGVITGDTSVVADQTARTIFGLTENDIITEK